MKNDSDIPTEGNSSMRKTTEVVGGAGSATVLALIAALAAAKVHMDITSDGKEPSSPHPIEDVRAPLYSGNKVPFTSSEIAQDRPAWLKEIIPT